MMIHTKKLIATSLAMLLTAPAFAGASLDTLLGGGSLLSNDGKLVFSDFEFTPVTNAPSASDIEIMALDSGLLFGTPTFTKSVTGIIDFDISYKVSGVDAQIFSATTTAQASVSGSGEVLLSKTIAGANNQVLANLSGGISSSASSSTSEVQLTPQNSVLVSDGIYASSVESISSAVSAAQTYSTSSDEIAEPLSIDPGSVPSPTAALAGMVLLGAMGVRRRRRG